MFHLLSDHLGSTSITADPVNGNQLTAMRYYPWGEERYANGTLNTTFRYTGQRQEDYIKLIQMGSRWYDSELGRFASPDTIVPEPYDPQDWDRYAYVRNNPIKYKDPTGHAVYEDGPTGCGFACQPISQNPTTTSDGHQVMTHNIDHEIGGWQLQFTGIAGFPSNFHRRNGEKISFLLFYGVSFVVDFDGGFQIYGLQRDIKFNPRLEQGPAELKYSTDVLGFGATVATGPIFGEGIKQENGGTANYSGQAVDYLIGAGPISLDYYEAFDEETGATNPNKLHGADIGWSWGFPVSIGRMSTYAIPWMRRQDINN